MSKPNIKPLESDSEEYDILGYDILGLWTREAERTCIWIIDKQCQYAYNGGELALSFKGDTTPVIPYNTSISMMANTFNYHPYCRKHKIHGTFSSNFVSTAREIRLYIFGPVPWGDIDYISILPGNFTIADGQQTRVTPTISRASTGDN
jgi:hypothetical protein